MDKNIFLIIMALFHFDLLSEDRISIATYSHFNSESEPEKWWKSGNQNKKPIILPEVLTEKLVIEYLNEEY